MRTLIIILCLAVAFWMASCNPDQITGKTVGRYKSDDSTLSISLNGHYIYMNTVVDNEGCTWVLGRIYDGSLQMQHSPCCKNPNHAK